MTARDGERIAKVLARAGIASRREAEKMIEAGRVSVNGAVIDRAALNVGPQDRVEVDGRPLDAPEPPRMWLYHKPAGLVTTTKDEQGRRTIFDELPEDLPRVMSIGRLDITSEGLLLLTNDGGIKRRLELPSTGWLRRYRVRINGRPQDGDFDPLRKGVEVDGERFQPMVVTLDRQQGANAWATVGIREGKNREVRRAMEAVGFKVNRLIRISYGPFQLGQLKPGAVEELRPRVVRDQLGMEPDTDDDSGRATRKVRTRPGRREAGADGGAPTAGGGPGPRRAGGPDGGAKAGRAGSGPKRGAASGQRSDRPGRTSARPPEDAPSSASRPAGKGGVRKARASGSGFDDVPGTAARRGGKGAATGGGAGTGPKRSVRTRTSRSADDAGPSSTGRGRSDPGRPGGPRRGPKS